LFKGRGRARSVIFSTVFADRSCPWGKTRQGIAKAKIKKEKFLFFIDASQESKSFYPLPQGLSIKQNFSAHVAIIPFLYT
jgi:hypothetical protein